MTYTIKQSDHFTAIIIRQNLD